MSYYNESGFSAVDNFIINVGKEYNDTKRSRDKINTNTSALRRSSIMRAAKDLVMSFPVICSDSLQPSTAAMITKAIERNCVTELQLLFSASYLKGANGFEVLRNFHKNIDDDISMDDYLDIVDTISKTLNECKLSRDTVVYENASGNKLTYSDFIKKTGIEAANQKRLAESFNKLSLNTFSITESYNGYKVDQDIFKESDEYEAKRYDLDVQRMNAQQARDSVRDRQWEKDFELKHLTLQQQKDLAAQQKAIANREFEYKKQTDFDKTSHMTSQDNIDYLSKQLLDNDVKKCNELVPSMLIVRYVTPNANATGGVIEQQFIAGVKANLYPSSSREIMDKIKNVFDRTSGKLGWIRATTGEIKFMRDFILGIDKAKIDAKNNSNLSKTNPIWRHLQYRSNKSVLNRLRKNKANDAGAITTLVLNAEEVEAIKKDLDIDLYDTKNATKLMEAYNFMGLVIVDENFEVARFLFDGEKYYQDIAFTSLERESNDSSYKKVVNLLSKVNRG